MRTAFKRRPNQVRPRLDGKLLRGKRSPRGGRSRKKGTLCLACGAPEAVVQAGRRSSARSATIFLSRPLSCSSSRRRRISWAAAPRTSSSSRNAAHVANLAHRLLLREMGFVILIPFARPRAAADRDDILVAPANCALRGVMSRYWQSCPFVPNWLKPFNASQHRALKPVNAIGGSLPRRLDDARRNRLSQAARLVALIIRQLRVSGSYSMPVMLAEKPRPGFGRLARVSMPRPRKA